jgi:hypothetical protein
VERRLFDVVWWRRAAAFAISLVNIAVALFVLGTLGYVVIGLVVSIPDIYRALTLPAGAQLSLSESFSLALMKVFVFLALGVIVAAYTVPIVLPLPVYAPIVALWERPPRFLLLRPFHRGPLSRPLKRIARRHLAPYGHTYTLADADIHVPWYVRIPILFGQLPLFSFRFRQIRRPQRLERLDRAMRRTWLRNVNWCMSWSKLFAVACADAHWQAAVALLMTRADVIVVDVVNLRENVAWEIEHAYAEGGADRLLYLAPAADAQEGAGKLKALLGDRLDAARIFIYDSRGVLEPARFRAVLAETLASRASLRPSRLAIAATTLFVLTAVPLIALPFPFLGIPLLPRWNEWSDSQTWPGLAAIVNPGALATMGLGVVTWLVLAAAARRNHAIRFLLTVQTLLLLAAAAGTMANR